MWQAARGLEQSTPVFGMVIIGIDVDVLRYPYDVMAYAPGCAQVRQTSNEYWNAIALQGDWVATGHSGPLCNSDDPANDATRPQAPGDDHRPYPAGRAG